MVEKLSYNNLPSDTVKKLFQACAVLALLTVFTTKYLQAAGIAVDPDISYQSMNGWEVTGRMWQFDKDNDRFNDEWESHADAILDKLVNEVGINRFRLEALSGMENPVDYWSQFVSGSIGYSEFREHFYEKINDNDDSRVTDLSKFNFAYMDYIIEKMLLPIKQRVEANGESLYLNLNYVDFKWTDLKGDIEHASSPQEYAEFIVVVFERLRDKYQLIPDALEIVLEADNTDAWSGANIGKGLLAAKERLNEAGFYPEFIGPSTALASRATTYFDGIVSVPGAADALDMFSYHRYDSSVDKNTLQNIEEAARTWNLQTGMLEHVGADSDELIDDLIYGNISSWQQYGIATNLLDNPGGYYLKVDMENPDSPNVYLDSRAVGLSVIFNHVRIGASRVSAMADDTSLTPVAFVNENGSHVLSVRSSSAQSVEVSGLPNGAYGIVHATTDGQLTQEDSIDFSQGESFEVELAQGLTTLHSDTSPNIAAALGVASSASTEANGSSASSSTASSANSGGATLFLTGFLLLASSFRFLRFQSSTT